MTEIESGTQLLVEGKDQQNFFESFIKHLSLENIQIQNFGGVDELPNFLKQFVKARGFSSITCIGIIRDAENKSAVAVRESILSALRNTDPPIDDGLVKIFVLPDNIDKGMLETLLCKTFVDTDENTCIDSFLKCVDKIPGKSIKRYDKARTHAFLATQEHPHVSVGVAAQKGYWSFDHEVFTDIGLFLKDLRK